MRIPFVFFFASLAAVGGCAVPVEPDGDIQSASYALSSNPYAQCGEILALGLVDELQVSADQKTAATLLDWWCSNGASGSNSSGGGGANIDVIDALKIALTGNGATSELDFNAYCEANQDAYEASNFSMEALAKIANAHVVEAWKQCMLKENDGLVCIPSSAHPGELDFEYVWDTTDSALQLSLEWETDNVRSHAKSLPDTAFEGNRTVSFDVVNTAQPATVTLVALGERSGGSGFMTGCTVKVLPTNAKSLAPLYPCSAGGGFEWNPAVSVIGGGQHERIQVPGCE